MEKLCEFCRGLRPVVYCKADAALLCLYCDAKIHSANALFNRHHRTALCELCRCRPAYVKCLDHRMFMCNACDGSQHTSSSQHSQKHVIRSYTGCPSAKDFAALWGLQLNELDHDDNAHLDQTLSTSCGSCDSSVVNLDNHGKSFSPIQGLPGAEYEVGSSSQSFVVFNGRKEHKITSFILHQIAGLKRFQLAEGSSASAESDLSSSSHHKRFDENHDQHIRLSQNMTNFHQRESLLHDLKVDPSPFQFTQPEYLPPSSSPSTMGVLLQTESIWQCRSPVQSSQLWSQNMQDLGVCEDLICRDDFNIPDIDLTFENFDELFEGEQDHIRMLLDDKDVSNSAEKDMYVDKSDNSNSISMAEASEASSMSLNQPADLRTYAGACDKVENILGSMDSNSSCPIQSSSSNFSFCTSRFSTISSTGVGDCHNSQPSSDSPDKEGGHYEVRVHSLTRYKEKKHSRLIEKKIPYSSRKSTVHVRRQAKG